jgi:hypothetical protein
MQKNKEALSKKLFFILANLQLPLKALPEFALK